MIYKMVYDEDNHEDIEVDEPYDEVGDSNNSTHELIKIIKKYYNEDVMFEYTQKFESDLLMFFHRFYDLGLLTSQQFKILEDSLKFAQDKVAFMIKLNRAMGKKYKATDGYRKAFDVLEVMLAEPVNSTDIKEHLKRSIIRKIKERYE